jgi:hypothetical protein
MLFINWHYINLDLLTNPLFRYVFPSCVNVLALPGHRSLKGSEPTCCKVPAGNKAHPRKCMYTYESNILMKIVRAYVLFEESSQIYKYSQTLSI